MSKRVDDSPFIYRVFSYHEGIDYEIREFDTYEEAEDFRNHRSVPATWEIQAVAREEKKVEVSLSGVQGVPNTWMAAVFIPEDATGLQDVKYALTGAEAMALAEGADGKVMKLECKLVK